MAIRPIFIPKIEGPTLFSVVPVSFIWNPGMASSQKKKNVTALHSNAGELGYSPLLEVSTKSDIPIGRDLSAFNLSWHIGGENLSLESIYQGSKVFERGGPLTDILFLDSRSAKRDPRLRTLGRLVGFNLGETVYPTWPPTVFYDWLYINALFSRRNEVRSIHKYAGFTDIEFNPEKSINCQAKSLALFVSLQRRDLLEDVIASFDDFLDLATRNERSLISNRALPDIRSRHI